LENIPTELLALYAEIVRAAPTLEAAQAHLLNLFIDAKQVEMAIADATQTAIAYVTNQAKSRAETMNASS
jgi:hypothetical protein